MTGIPYYDIAESGGLRVMVGVPLSRGAPARPTKRDLRTHNEIDLRAWPRHEAIAFPLDDRVAFATELL